MAKLAIKGHATRGKEVIALLEMLGGKNIYNNNTGFDIGFYYSIEDGGIRSWECKYGNFEYMYFTLEEFLEKYPHKVGDKVIDKTDRLIGIVDEMYWEEHTSCVKYCVTFGCGVDFAWYSVQSLQPYKEETIEERGKNFAECIEKAVQECLFGKEKTMTEITFENSPQEVEIVLPKTHNKVWHDIDEEPIYENGVTPIIIDSNYGHISREGHYYNQVQWKSHIEFQKHREFKWAYEKDLMNL